MKYSQDICTNGCRIYMDVMTGENCRQLKLNSIINHFFYPIGGEGMVVKVVEVGESLF